MTARSLKTMLARSVLACLAAISLIACGSREPSTDAERLARGRELVEQIRPLRKDIRVIYMSGYTDDVLAYRGDLGQDINFLQKPFAPEALTKKVRDALK